MTADRGFEGTTVEEIAAEANVSKPVVDEHSGSRETLGGMVALTGLAGLERKPTLIATR